MRYYEEKIPVTHLRRTGRVIAVPDERDEPKPRRKSNREWAEDLIGM